MYVFVWLHRRFGCVSYDFVSNRICNFNKVSKSIDKHSRKKEPWFLLIFLCLFRTNTVCYWFFLAAFIWNLKWKYSWKTCSKSYFSVRFLPRLISPFEKHIPFFLNSSLSTNPRWCNGNAIKYAQVCSVHIWCPGYTDTGSTFAIVTAIKCMFEHFLWFLSMSTSERRFAILHMPKIYAMQYCARVNICQILYF